MELIGTQGIFFVADDVIWIHLGSHSHVDHGWHEAANGQDQSDPHHGVNGVIPDLAVK